MATNKFYQFNADKNNMTNDYNYSVNATRIGGLLKGKASSSLHNKIFYQVSTMTAALGQMMANKGYEMSDSSLATLIAQLANIITRVDMEVYSTTLQMNAAIAAALVSYPTTAQMNTAIANAIRGLGGDNLTVAQVNALIAAGAVPVGSVHAMPTSVVPNGYLKCNGSAVSRTNYAALFAVISTYYGVGDGSTTFNLPDYRGYFLRGWDNGRGVDPDAAARTNRGDGTAGDQIGTKQEDELKSHKHSQFRTATVDEMYGFGSAGQTTTNLDTTTIQNTGGNESRPKNIYVMYVIKY